MKNERLMQKIEIDDFITAERTETWHKVAYDAKIKDLDILVKSTDDLDYYRKSDVESLKSQIVDLSTKYQVMSDYTAFLAVIQEISVGSQGERAKIIIPNMNSADYLSEAIDISTLKTSKEVNLNVKAKADLLNFNLIDPRLSSDEEGLDIDVNCEVEIEVDVQVDLYTLKVDEDVNVELQIDVQIDAPLVENSTVDEADVDSYIKTEGGVESILDADLSIEGDFYLLLVKRKKRKN